jgi:hypothetical protein
VYCTYRTVVFDKQRFEEIFDEEDRQEEEKNIYPFYPTLERKMKMECAEITHGTRKGPDTCTFIFAKPRSDNEDDDDDDEPKQPYKITMKVTAVKGTMDENFAGLYRDGKINHVFKDIYLKMKNHNLNTWTTELNQVNPES